MKTISNIISFPITLILGIVTCIICLPFIWTKIRKYNKGEIDNVTMMAEMSIIVNNFIIMSLWLDVPSGVRAIVTIVLSIYLFY